MAVKSWEEDAQLSDYHDLLQLTEEMLSGRGSNRTNTVITALAQYIIRSWRTHFARTVSMKFNCFFLMPFLDDFPIYLRDQLDEMYNSDMGEMFDIAEARMALQQKRAELMAECDANAKLQRRFDQINAQLRNRGGGHDSADDSNALDDLAANDGDEYAFDGDDMGVNGEVPVPVSAMGGGMDRDRDGASVGSGSGSGSVNEARDDPWQSLRKATEDARRSFDNEDDN
jgi:hypothetical protein